MPIRKLLPACSLFAAISLFIVSIATAQPLPDPVAYHSILGDDLTMNVWQGNYVSVLTPTSRSGLDNATMSSIVTTLDGAYEYYKLATGRDPAPFPPNYYINGRDTIAAVDHTGGAGYSWIGATGIELQTNWFNTLYNGVKNNNQYDQVAFYELGRNFWLFGNQLNGTSIGPTSFTTGFAVFMRFQSLDYTGQAGAPHGNWTYGQFKQNVINLVDQYTANPALNFANTLAVGQGVPGSSLGSTDLFASFLYRLGRDYGGETFYQNIWKKVGERPKASTDQGAIDNLFLASCYTTQQDLSNLFVSQWRWPISAAALLEATSIPVVGNAWNGSASNQWNNAANWTDGLPQNGDTITFATGAANKANNNNHLSRVGRVHFKEGGFNVGGNALQLDEGITSNGDNTWAVNSTLNAAQSFTNFSGTLTVGGTVNTNGKVLTLNGNGNTIVSAAISGSGGLVKDGTGQLELANNGTYSGNIVVNAGKVKMNHANALGTAVGTTTFNGGALVDLKTTSENFVIAGDARFENWGATPRVNGSIAVSSGAALTFSTGGGNQTWVTGPITGGGNFIWQGGGATEVWIDTASYIDGTAANTLSGMFTLEKGTLTLAKTGGTNKAVAGNLTIGGGSNRAQLRINSSEQIGDSSMLTFTGTDARFYTQGHSETLGALNVRGFGTIDFNDGNSTVRFADSSDNAWKKTLKLQNYTTGSDHLYVGANSGGLSEVQLQRLQFVDPAGKDPGTYAGQILPTGEVVPGPVWTAPATNPQFPLVPYPATVQPGTGSMALGAAGSIVVNDAALRSLGGVLSNEVFAITGKRLSVRRGTPNPGDIVLALAPSLSGESYVYNVQTQAQVRGGNYQSVAQGTVTLMQSMTNSNGAVSLPQAHIADRPSEGTPYRAIQIDVARSYHGIEGLKKMVDLCRLYKVPYMQLHLTDDQAFTFATSVSGVNGGNTTGTAGDPRKIPVYSQQQLRDLVSYADQRGVTIIPEFEIPGHAAQLVSRRPDLFKTGTYHHATANIANPAAVTAIKTIVAEMASVFASSPYIHLGGDEADYSELWYQKSTTNVYPAVRAQWDAKMDELSAQAGMPAGSIRNPEAVFRDYLNDMNDYVKSLGKNVIVWESFGITSDTVPMDKDILVMPFDQYSGATNYINACFNLINSSWSPLYVVGFKGDGTGSGVGWNEPVENIYAWDKQRFGPYHSSQSPPPSPHVVSDALAGKILGGQLNLWENQESAEITAARQRLAAMSERLWSAESDWSYDDFAARLAHTDALLTSLLTTSGAALTPWTWESVWNGSAGNAWNTPGNWSEGAPWDGDAITFAAGATGKNCTNNFSPAALTHVGPVVFHEGGFNVGGNPLQLDAGIVSTGDNTWAVPSTLAAPQAFESLGGTLTVSGTVNTNGHALTIAGEGNTSISGAISGPGLLVKTGDGVLLLSGENSYNGGTFVSQGVLQVAGASALPAGESLSIGAGGTVVFFVPAGAAHTPSDTSLADTVAAVPEPSAFLLLTAGVCCALAGWLQKRHYRG